MKFWFHWNRQPSEENTNYEAAIQAFVTKKYPDEAALIYGMLANFKGDPHAWYIRIRKKVVEKLHQEKHLNNDQQERNFPPLPHTSQGMFLPSPKPLPSPGDNECFYCYYN